MQETDAEMQHHNPSDDALAQLIALLRERLAQALGRAVQAQVMVSEEKNDAAIGSLAGMEIDLADATALQRSVVLLPRRG